MRTLDEAIAHEREVANFNRVHMDEDFHNDQVNELYKAKCQQNMEEHEQIAECLEDYKRLKDNIAFISSRPIEDVYLEAYNKAIDDFVNKIHESNQGHLRVTGYEHGEAVSETMSYDIGTIELIADQLKAGGDNETNN